MPFTPSPLLCPPTHTPVFFCHTMYHVLLALLRTMRHCAAGGAKARLLLVATLPDVQALAGRLLAAGGGLWADVSVIEEQKLDVQNSESRFYRLRHPHRTPYLSLPETSWVYISNDWSACGRFLQRAQIPYTLCEDTVGGTLDPDQHLLTEQRAAPHPNRQRYQYWGDSPLCRAVESEDPAQCALFPPEKLRAFSAKALLHSLTDAEKAAVRAVFVTGPLPADPAAFAGATLLLPRSFVLDGLMDQKTQDAMFLAVAKRYADGPLFIKTHPRDETDYAALFPDATILDRTMPSEVLNFCLPGKFKRAVTVQSWVLRGFEAAEETVFLTLDEAKELAGFIN